MTTKLAIAILALALPAAALAGEDAPLRTVAPDAVQSVHADSVRYAVRISDNNLIGTTVTNYGFIGNNFVSRSPSLEYPLGTGYEHMVRGGFWIGAHALDDQGAFIGVTTGAVDGAQGSSSQQATEFSPAGVEIAVRSTLPNSRYYAPGQAVSEQDYVTEFSDLPSRQVPGYNENHRALQILVRQENYAWSFSDYQHVLIFHLVIKNIGPPLANAWVGLYTEFASGNKNDYTIWPPSSSGSTVGSWFRKKWVVYEDSLRLFREHYCETVPIPEGCTLARAPYWIGKKLLGISPGNLADTLDKRITLSAWDYSPGNTIRDQDIERYALLSAGTIADLNTPELQPNTGDPTALLAVGPFAQIDPGDSIEVDFALVGGQLASDIQRHARFAQNAYDRDYIVPVPPPSPRFKAVAVGSPGTELEFAL